MPTAIESRLQANFDTRADLHARADELLGKDSLTESEKTVLRSYREEMAQIDEQNKELVEQKEADDVAAKTSQLLRTAAMDVSGVSEDGPIYRTMAEYARDVILTRDSNRDVGKIQSQFGDKDSVESARAKIELLKRTPANTLSSNVGGLQPPQHIDQIFQVINASRPLVDSALKSTLERGTLTYPKVTTRPVVAVQASEKTEAGNTGMVVDMETTTASTYLGGGDLSWQAINWSSPDALDLWFRLAAADYALKTEQDAGNVLTDNAFTHKISSTVSGTVTFADLMTAIGAGYAAVYANSGRIANTVWMAPDRFGYLLGLTSSSFTQFTTVSANGIGPLNVVISRGMDAGEIVVGDREGLLVAETAGAPVELRVVEPAIGGVEVGIIGAFEAVVVDDGAFSLITTAS